MYTQLFSVNIFKKFCYLSTDVVYLKSAKYSAYSQFSSFFEHIDKFIKMLSIKSFLM